MPAIVSDVATGNVIWNSDLVSAGVLADVKEYTANQTGVLEYPAFAGRQAYIVNLRAWSWPQSIGLALDQSKGWPRVTVSTSVDSRRFTVLII